MTKVLAVLLMVPAIGTAVVGLDYALRGVGLEFIQLRIPRTGGWSLFVGLCCLATAWYAKTGLTALWKKL